MKNSTEEKKAYERMKPGAITAQGFLGDDDRGLADIVAADEEAFRRHALVFEVVAEELERLRDAGGRGLGEAVTVEGKWLVQAGDARGVLPCPWGDGVFHKNAIEVERVETGSRVAYSDLSIHMLRAHHFCQGKGHSFRLEPETLKKLFG